MDRIINKLVGSKEERSLEQMLFICCIFLSGIGGLAITILNIFNGLYFQIFITSSIMLISGLIYYISRFKRKYFFISAFIVIVILLYIAYFDALGITGPLPFYFIVILILTLVYNPVKWHAKIFLFHSSAMGLIFLLEYMFPEWINNPFRSKDVVHMYMIVGLMFCISLSFISIYILRQSYDNEKEKNQKQKELLERTAHQKSMFFINLSHEIKTPLTLVENYLEKYIEHNGENNELIIMRQNIRKMRRDILDYLNFENIERGKISFDTNEVFALDKFLEEKIKLFICYAENRCIKLNSTLDSGILIKANSRGIDQVLNNLLENAVKYTPENGEINVWLKVEHETAKLTIQNTGAIIPNDQLPYLFEPFYQLSREKSNSQGIGMGLYTVKKILDNIGAKIEVKSSNEHGISFSVTLPLSIEQQVTVRPINNISEVNINMLLPKATDSIFLTNRPTILLVEDHNDLLRYLADILSQTYNVFVAENGLVALKKLQNIPIPDLIISDIMMDTMDGYELLEKTLSDKRLAHIPFIFLTAKDEPNEKNASFKMGVLDFITKPFSIDDLKLKIKAIIEQKERISEAAIGILKKQFSENQFSHIKQKQADTFHSNALRYNLSSREQEVVAFVKQGLKYEEIGLKLHISEHTVNRHVQNIYEKTCSNSKLDLLEKLYSFEY